MALREHERRRCSRRRRRRHLIVDGGERRLALRGVSRQRTRLASFRSRKTKTTMRIENDRVGRIDAVDKLPLFRKCLRNLKNN